ncbi:threonine synthase [Halobacteriales archaeon QS_1_68_17]|nr:MAG: threonine synthase [Halobacteriales archaeon QS_1_68_17]
MLRCYECDETYADGSRQRCRCGEPLWFAVGAAAIDADADGLERYREFLPVEPRIELGTGVGDTPLYDADGLGAYAGCDLYVKDEGRNPTGSFKDRGSVVGVADALARRAGAVGTVSHGNMAMSMAATAASAGVDCLVFVPADIPPERLGHISQFGPRLVTVAGDYRRLYEASLSLARDRDVAFVNSDAPARVAGQKTTGMDAVWKGALDLRRAGVIDALPRLYFVQSAACDPIASAFAAGADRVETQAAGETVAYSIANGDPPSGNRALAAARETGGAVLSVDDDEIRDAAARLATAAGVSAEASAATSLAGVRRLTDGGEIDRDERVVVVVTGTGFKESPLGPAPDPERVAIDDLGPYLDGALG